METASRRILIGLAGWLHCPPWSMLILAAVLMGLAPFWPEPHLLQKAVMLMHGKPFRVIDVVDVFWHGWPLVWIMARLLTPGAAGFCRIPERRA